MIPCCSYQLYHLFGKLLCSLTSITTFTICSNNFKISVLGSLFYCVEFTKLFALLLFPIFYDILLFAFPTNLVSI